MADSNGEFEASKSEIIKGLFCDSADQNYIVARWCFQSGLNLDFYWNAVHALEKYMKAILLFDGLSVKGNYGHDIFKLFLDVREAHKDLLIVEFSEVYQVKMEFESCETVEIFVKRMNDYGSADSRYNIFGHLKFSDDLFKLDQLVFCLGKILPFEGISRFCKLSKDIRNSAIIHAALNQNFPFAPAEYAHTNFRNSTSSENSALFREVSWSDTFGDGSHAVQQRLIDWALGSMQLPKDAINWLQDTKLGTQKGSII